MRRAVATAFSRAQEILTSNRELLERSAAQLLVKETLDVNDLAGLFSNIKPAPTGGCSRVEAVAPYGRGT